MTFTKKRPRDQSHDSLPPPRRDMPRPGEPRSSSGQHGHAQSRDHHPSSKVPPSSTIVSSTPSSSQSSTSQSSSIGHPSQSSPSTSKSSMQMDAKSPSSSASQSSSTEKRRLPPVTSQVKAPPPPKKPSIMEQSEENFAFEIDKIETQIHEQLQRLLEDFRSSLTDLVTKSLELGNSMDDDIKARMERCGGILASVRTFHRLLHSQTEFRRTKTITFIDDTLNDTIQMLKSIEYEKETFDAIVKSQPSLADAEGIVSEEEFLKESIGTEYEWKSEDTYRQRNAKRLKYERDKRNYLSQKLAEIPTQIGQLKSTLRTENANIDRMKRTVKEIVDVFNPKVDLLQLKSLHNLDNFDSKASSFLPQPLYNFYIQMCSYITVYESSHTANDHHDKSATQPSIEISISGNVESAKKNQFQRDLSILPLSSEKAQAVHPLSLIVAFSKIGHRKISFRLEYLYNLNVVSITPNNVEEHPKILANLYEGDDGQWTPNFQNHFLLFDPSKSSSSPFFYRTRVYKWLQSLCGLSFPPPPTFINGTSTTNFEISPIATAGPFTTYSFTETIMKWVSRLVSKSNQTSAFKLLSSGKYSMEFSIKPKSLPSLAFQNQWNELNPPSPQQWSDFFSNYSPIGSSSMASNPANPDPNFTYIQVSFSAPGMPHLNLYLMIQIESDYPITWPKIWIKGDGDLAADGNQFGEIILLRSALENDFKPEIPSNNPENLLSYYLSYLRDCFNIMIDVTLKGSNSEFASIETRYNPSTW